MRRTRPMKRAARAPARPRRAGGGASALPVRCRTTSAVRRAALVLVLSAQARGAAAGEGHLQLELGLLPRTVIDAQAGEHFGVDTEPGPTGTLAAGRRIGAWRVRLALGHRYVNTDGLLKADFQTNGSLTLWSGLLEAFRDVDLDPATGLPLEVFAGLGAGVAYADLHDFGRGNGGEMVPVGDAQAGLAWRVRPGLALLGGGRLLATGTFDSPGEERGEPHTSGRLVAPELFAGLRLGF
jgi:hypothetical protein